MTRKSALARTNPEKEPIAIVGIGCRYPGGVKDTKTFWKLLIDGVDAISDIPADRTTVAPLYDPTPAAPGKIASSQGGFLDRLDQFDASFFGVSPREAEFMDPQQRLLLETSWEALEDAGQIPDELKESQTGVFVGMWNNDYTEKMYREIDDINLYVTTGGGRYAASGRLSYFFGFQGPSMTVDTACSSSLVTVHLACQSLWEGESDLALAGGVNLILEPAISIGYSRSKILSPDGRCKFGDIRANGYVRSEGIGMIVLKRLSDAIADNDRIYAVVRGSAVNNDGRSSELLVAPGIGSQVKMLRDAYRNAGVDPCQVGYVEAHGTGTPVGDPVEMEALGSVLSENRDASRPVRVGSIKTNIGHTEAASGVAGLIKTALILQHKAIPPSLHFHQPNPKIAWKDMKLEMQTEVTPWPFPGETAFAAVNSFGITGTNAHVVLEEAPPQETQSDTDEQDSAVLLPLSAQTPEALQAVVESYRKYLSNEKTASLPDIVFTASRRRTHHATRLAVVGKSHLELVEQLSLYSGDTQTQTRSDQERKTAFVFSGQGSQWAGMGRELMQTEPLFREKILKIDQLLRQYVSWSLVDELNASEENSRLAETEVAQPAIFAMQVALVEVWRSWGIEPSAVVGHSVGEIAAAHVAGVLSLEDAVCVVYHRSRLMQRVTGQGRMAALGITRQQAEELLARYTGLSLGAVNGPSSTVLSGNADALEEIVASLSSQGIFARMMPVNYAFHSPVMDGLMEELTESLRGITAAAPKLALYSTVRGDRYEEGDYGSAYWAKNIRQAVLFGPAVATMNASGFDTFVEVAPHPVLAESIRQSLDDGTDRLVVSSLRRGQSERGVMLQSLGTLFANGYAVNWSQLYPQGNVVDLPAYPWQRERYWFEPSVAQKQERPGAHPLLHQYVRSATGEQIWETALSTKLFPYLNDHQIRGSAVFPAAGYVEMVLGAVKEIHPAKQYALKALTFREALFLSAEETRMIQLVLDSETPGLGEFHFYSRASQADSWTLHASGQIELLQEENGEVHPKPSSPKGIEIASEDFYGMASGRGISYGPEFQAITGLTRDESALFAKIELPESLASKTARYQLHPVLIDACIQALLAALPDTNQDTYLPTSIERIQVYGSPNFNTPLRCEANPEEGNLQLFDQDGKLILAVHGLRMQRVESKVQDAGELLYSIQWQESPIPFHEHQEPQHWLILADVEGLGEALGESLKHDGQSYSIISASDPVQLKVDQPVHHIVHLGSLDRESTPSIADENLRGILSLTQQIAASDSSQLRRLWLVTRGAQSVNGQPEPVFVSQASVWGMGAVIANEIPGLHCTRVDLGASAGQGEVEMLSRALLSGDEEGQVALRNRQRYVARLKRIQSPAEKDPAQVVRKQVTAGQSFSVQVTARGILDSLSLKPALQKRPAAGQVEIEVKATGLNFMNVMAALGVLPGYEGGVGPLGIECSGVIASIGEDVEGFQVGDEVAAVAFDSLASHALTDARLVVKKPSTLSFEQAAAIPIAYLTAYYALHHLGRMEAGERVLIHAATGGVGLAAIQLAKRAGAEIFATAGSSEKRELLQSMGVRHIMDSRSLEFAENVMKSTNGEGVDIVLNSLAGPAIAKGLEILKPYGRFLEIGKRDIYGNSKVGLLPFQKNLSYFAIDLDKMSRERPDLIGRMLRQVFALLEAREIEALPVQTFPVSQAGDGFRTMAQAKHIGKIAISMEDAQAAVDLPAGMPIHANGTYLITGGLGDLGLAFAQWLAKQGAGHLALLGRSRPSPGAQAVIDELNAARVQTVAFQADVAKRDELERAFSEIRRTLPPLKGILHAAGLVADGTILNMDWERFQQAYAPKAVGAWNLHTLTGNDKLDFFVMFSSVAATLGTPGQINYAAGNAAMDGLVRFRAAQGLPALSINWGPWVEIGMASTQFNRGARLSQQGLRSISPSQGLQAMAVAMAQGIPQIGVMALDAKQWCAAQPAAARSQLFKELLDGSSVAETEVRSHGRNIRDELMAVSSGKQRQAMLETHVREQVAQVLHLVPARIPVDKPLKTLGIDSLMSIELSHRLEDSLHTSLSASLSWNYPTVRALTTYLGDKLGVSFETNSEPAAPKPEDTAEPELENLSKAELDAMLKEELDAIEDLLGDN